MSNDYDNYFQIVSMFCQLCIERNSAGMNVKGIAEEEDEIIALCIAEETRASLWL